MSPEEQQELVEDLRTLADFYERPEALALPAMYLSEYHNVSVWEFSEADGKYSVSPEKSKAAMREVVLALGKCEKKYEDGSLSVVKKMGHNIRLTYSVDRTTFCTKVVTGTRIIPAQPEREVEEVEWVCNDMSLLK